MLATATDKRLLQSKLRPVARELLAIRVVAEHERERADTRHAAILAAGDFRDDEGVRITDPKTSWHIVESQYPAYSALCDAANRDAGYDVRPGYCPALIAEDAVIKLENSLLKIAAELIDPVFAEIWDMGKRAEAIRLLCGLALAK